MLPDPPPGEEHFLSAEQNARAGSYLSCPLIYTKLGSI
jgi:hypothetical protein